MSDPHPRPGAAAPAVTPAEEQRARRLARAFAALVALTWGLVVLGALVRAHDAGLACPDWPRCFGVWLPELDLRVAFEWTHRLVAGSISLLFVGLGALALLRPATRRAAARPLALAAVLLGVQIVLGGLTVLLQLASWTVTAHLLTGNAFAATLLWSARNLHEVAEPHPRPALPTGVRRLVWAGAALLVLQVALGGLVSSSHAGMACPEWPACNGGAWFPSWRGPVGLHLAHRTNAYLLIATLWTAAWAARRHPGVVHPLRLAAGLALVQAAVGIANVKLGIPVEITGLHSAVSAALVLAMAWTAREAWLRPVGHDAAMRPRVVVIGAGFGGLAVAKALRDVPADVWILDRENYHAFLPLLYQVATSGLSAQDVTHPVRSIVRRLPNVRFRMGEVVGVDFAGRAVEIGDGARIRYDALVISAGSTTEFFGNESAAAHSFPLHHVEEAIALRNHVLVCLERAAEASDANEREALLGFVVVGGGPTGVELAGMLGELRRHVVPRDFPGLESAMRVLLVEGQERLLGALPEPLCRRALEQVRELGVEVRLGTMVETIDAEGVRLRGERVRARTVAWAAGVRGAPLGARLGVELPRNGRVPVAPSLQLEGHPEVYVIGDLAAVRGAETIPQVARAAIQQGRHAARNWVRAQAGRDPEPFAYRDPGTMATIGRNRAVAWLRGLQLSGRPAWWIWLVVHIVFLAGFRNRASVFVNWIYHYVTYDLGMRSIVGRRSPHGVAGHGSGSARNGGAVDAA